MYDPVISKMIIEAVRNLPTEVHRDRHRVSKATVDLAVFEEVISCQPGLFHSTAPGLPGPSLRTGST